MVTEPDGADVMRLLANALTGDYVAAGETLADIAERGGPGALYATACGLAETVVLSTGMRADSDNFIGLEFDERLDAAKVWAGRFVTAHANGDIESTLALFKAVVSETDHHWVECMRDLLEIAAAALSATRDEGTGQ